MYLRHDRRHERGGDETFFASIPYTSLGMPPHGATQALRGKGAHLRGPSCRILTKGEQGSLNLLDARVAYVLTKNMENPTPRWKGPE